MPILPAEGSPVTIVDKDGRTLWRMKVHAVDGSPDFKITAVAGTWASGDRFTEIFPDDEGVSWCRGWEGPGVDALKATAALR